MASFQSTYYSTGIRYGPSGWSYAQQKDAVNPKASSSAETEEARIALQAAGFSSITLDEFFSRWNGATTTDLQRDELVKEITGKTIIWTGKINSIKSGKEDGVEVVVGPPKEAPAYEYAFLAFDSLQRSVFLSLKEGQVIRFTCNVRELHIGNPFLDKCKLLHVIESQQ